MEDLVEHLVILLSDLGMGEGDLVEVYRHLELEGAILSPDDD